MLAPAISLTPSSVMGYPKADIHYRIAKLAVSSTYIGVPLELLTGSATPGERMSTKAR